MSTRKATTATTPECAEAGPHTARPSLHKKVLKKNTTAKSIQPSQAERPPKTKTAESDKVPPQVPERRKRAVAASSSNVAKQTAASDAASVESGSVPEVKAAFEAAVEKVLDWEQCGISPQGDHV